LGKAVYGGVKGGDQMKSLSVKLGVILVGLIIFTHVEVWGADWKFVSSTDLYKGFYYGEKMTKPYKGISLVRVWVKLEYTEKGIAEYVKKFGKDYENLSYSLELWDIDCKTRRYIIWSTTQYSIKGNIINDP
jgi:hypothetical protein